MCGLEIKNVDRNCEGCGTVMKRELSKLHECYHHHHHHCRRRLLVTRWRSSGKSRSQQQIKAIYLNSLRIMCPVECIVLLLLLSSPSLSSSSYRPSQLSSDLRHRSAAARLLVFGARIPPGHGSLSVLIVAYCQVEVSARVYPSSRGVLLSVVHPTV